MARRANWNRLHNEGGEGYNPHGDDHFALLGKMDDARIAKYGATSCPHCGKVYEVNEATLAVEDHAASCTPISADKAYSL